LLAAILCFVKFEIEKDRENGKLGIFNRIENLKIENWSKG